MLDRLFGRPIHPIVHLIGLSALAVGIPSNKIVMSLAMMLLLLNLFLAADFRPYYDRLKSSRLFLLLLAFFLLHFVALGWTEDYSYALSDIRTKLPLLVIPLVLIALPPSEKQRNFLLHVFAFATVACSLINFGAYQQLFGHWDFDDIRGMSLFGSHVRFSLMVAFGAGICLSLLRKQSPYRIFYLFCFLWLVYYSYYSQVLSGSMSLLGILFVFAGSWLWSKNKWICTVSAIIFFSVAATFLYLLAKPLSIDPNAYQNLPELSHEGNAYVHDLKQISPETGKPVGIFVCLTELEREWNQASSIPFSGRDKRGNLIKWTLIRYMASLDLKKDSEGFQKLTPDDIKAVEMGNASVHYKGIRARYYDIKFQLNNEKDPNNHSLLQRIEYWKAGVSIAREHLLIGVGTGDVQRAFDDYYDSTNSILDPENRRRTHNYFLTILLTFGIPGLFLFLWIHSEFLLKTSTRGDLLGVAFIVIMLLSYLIEDTWETQAGVTFFAYFYALFARAD